MIGQTGAPPPTAGQVLTAPRAVTLLLAATCIALLALIAYWRLTPPLVPSSAAWRGNTLVVSDSRGRTCWTRLFPLFDNPPTAIDRYVAERLQVDDIDGDGNPEVLVDQSTMNPVRTSLLTCLNRDGSLRWEFEYGRRKLWKGREFSPLYRAQLVRVLKKRDHSYVMVVGIHVPYFPSQVAFLDARSGVAIGEYWHPGHLNVSSLVDLDGDGFEEILLGGINNPGPGLGYPAIAVLPSPFLPGGPIGRSSSIDSWGGDERAYLLLPRSDVAECRQQLTVVSQFLVPEPGMIEVSVTGGDGRNPFDSWGGYYRLTFALRLLDFRPGEWMGSTHAKLQRDGQLDHPFGEAEMDALRRILYFNRAPDGNGSEVERVRVLTVQQQIADNETRSVTRPPASPE